MLRLLCLIILILTIGVNASAGPKDSANKAPCHWQQAKQHLNKFQFQDALPILTTCYQITDSSQPLIEEKLALAYFKLGQFKPAQFHYQNVLDKDSGNIAVLNRLALIELKTNDDEKAEAYYQKLITLDSTNAYYYSQIADIAKKNSNWQKAITYYRKTLGMNEKDTKSITELSELLLKNKALESADKWIKRGMTLDSTNLRLRGLKAKLAYRQQNYDQVISSTGYILEGGDTTKTYLKLSGIAHLQMGQHPKAIQHLQKANALKGKSELIPYYLGIAYRKAGETGKATRYIEEAVKEGTSNNLALFYQQLAHTYEEEDNYSAAIEAFKKAYAHSENEQLLYHMARAYDTYYKDKKPAIRYYQKYLAKHDTTHEELARYAKQRVNRLKQIRHFQIDSLASNKHGK